jgi:hypothetical protein
MPESIEQILDAVNSVVAQVHRLSDRRPDAKIGSAGRMFNSLLREAKRAAPNRTLIAEMEELSDQDTVVAYMSALGLLQAELVSASNEAYAALKRGAASRPPYAD